MRKSIHVILFSLSLIAVTFAAKKTDSFDQVVPGIVIVKFDENNALGKIAANDNINQVVQKYDIRAFTPVFKEKINFRKSGPQNSLNSVYFAAFNSAVSPQIVAQELEASSERVIYAEPKYVHYISEQPNDSLFQLQYHLQNIQATEAWDNTTGDQGNVVIAIVDGGTEIQHPDLKDVLWINPGEIPGDNIDNDNNGRIDDIHGWNFPGNSGDPTGLPSTPINANHGTHTAGIAAATTNNRVGIAGVSHNARLMAINSGSPNTDNSLTFSYEGILYAARNGADVISCSWGRTGSASQFEQEVINEAVANGAVVVAAAGNNNSDGNYFPAQYNHVFSVAAVNSDDVRAPFSNFGFTIDVSAPGVAILSTTRLAAYGELNGTSMACPVAAGVVALVKTQNPSWTGMQAAEQMRISADNIDAQNSNYINQLGTGRVNAFRALTLASPAIRIEDFVYTDDGDDGIIEPGEKANIQIKVKNYLQSADNISFELIANDQYVDLIQSTAELSQLGKLESAFLPEVFTLQVSNDAPTGHVINFILKITSGEYQDLDHFSIMVLPTFANTDINNVNVTVTNIGRIGFADMNLAGTGIGFTYKNGPNLLFEGALMAGLSASKVSNAARGVSVESDQDFEVTEDGNLEVRTPGSESAQESKGRFADNLASSPIPVEIEQTTFASDDPDKSDFVIFKYRIENTSSAYLKNLHFGLFFDWDLDGANYATNVVGYEAVNRMGYVYDSGNGPETYAAVSLLTGQGINFRAIYNDENAPGNPSWGIYDGFTDSEKWDALSGGLTYTTAGPEDVSFTIAAGPIDIEPRGVTTVTFAMLAADDLTSLKAYADSAQAYWDALAPLEVDQEDRELHNPFTYQLSQNYPNPFNPETRIKFTIAQTSQVELAIYNALGEKVATLVNSNLPAGNYNVLWNARGFATGVYFYQLRADGYLERRKMMLLR